MPKINLKDIVKAVDEAWQPKDVAFINDTALRIARIDGVYKWHTHSNEDEFFYVIKGKIHLDFENESIELKEGEGLLVKRGMRHRSRSDKPAFVLLIEPTRTKTKGEDREGDQDV